MYASDSVDHSSYKATDKWIIRSSSMATQTAVREKPLKVHAKLAKSERYKSSLSNVLHAVIKIVEQ